LNQGNFIRDQACKSCQKQQNKSAAHTRNAPEKHRQTEQKQQPINKSS